MERIVLQNVSRNFGGLKAISDVSLTTRSGEIFGIIGPNGAGKTTLFNLIAGHYKPSSGRVLLDAKDVSGRAPHEIASRGLARSFQMPRLFKTDTVHENLLRAQKFGVIPAPWALIGKSRSRVNNSSPERIAEMVGLSDLLGAQAGSLAYGLQKALGIGLALATNPTILLMDEPAAGLNPSEKNGMSHLIARLGREIGIDIVVIEHDMKLVMGICDRIAVLNRGRLIALASPAEIQANADVIEAYLGPDHELA